MLETLTSGEVTEIVEYARRVPLPEHRRTLDAAKVALIAARSQGNKIDWSDLWEWFDPDPWRRPEGDEQSAEEMEAAFGRIVVRGRD